VQLFDGNATLLGQKAYALQSYEQLQPNVADVFAGIATTNARITATATEGTGSVLLAGAQLANESQDSSGFEMSFRDTLPGGGGGTAGVTSLNGLTGAVTLAAGSNVTLNKSGNTLTINAAAGGSGGGRTLPFSGAHPLVFQKEKSPVERGFDVNPDLYGAAPDRQIGWAGERLGAKPIEDSRPMPVEEGR